MATTLQSLVQQAIADIPTIQTNLAAHRANIDAANDTITAESAAADALNAQLRERLLIINVAKFVAGTATLDPVLP